jgi:ribonuclease H / adenosylcobalamin/alpha-ribazole phosphatase
MQTADNDKLTVDAKRSDPLIVFVDGSGCRLDGTGSGFAWLCTNTGGRAIEHVPGLTNNQAEYRALIAALAAMPSGAIVSLFSDSQLLCCQFNGKYRAKDPELSDLLVQAQRLVKEKSLSVSLQWVPRARNIAGKLL